MLGVGGGGLVNQKVVGIDPLVGSRPIPVVRRHTLGPWNTAVVTTSRRCGSEPPRLPLSPISLPHATRF